MIKQIIPQSYCSSCQGCCRFSQQDSVWQPVLLVEEIEDLLERNIPPSLISREKRIRSEPSSQGDNFTCSFFNPQDNQCKIYAFRPFECQLYPFLINRKGREVFLAVDLRCPFVQENSASPKYKEYIQYLSELFHDPRVRETLSNNTAIIQTYPEALNLLEIDLNS